MDGWILSFSEEAASLTDSYSHGAHRSEVEDSLIPATYSAFDAPDGSKQLGKRCFFPTQMTSEIVLKWYGQKTFLLPVVWC